MLPNALQYILLLSPSIIKLTSDDGYLPILCHHDHHHHHLTKHVTVFYLLLHCSRHQTLQILLSHSYQNSH
jgi:hypothetical protein